MSQRDQENTTRLQPYQRSFFHSGDRIPATGIYRVNHGNHRLPHEVTLLEGGTFPPCARCDYLVFFELIQSAPRLAGSAGLRFAVKLHAIPPVLEDDLEPRRR